MKVKHIDHIGIAVKSIEEELELPRESLDYFGDLGFFPSSIANAVLHVFVARWDGKGEPVPDPNEIDHLIEALTDVWKRLGLALKNAA